MRVLACVCVLALVECGGARTPPSSGDGDCTDVVGEPETTKIVLLKAYFEALRKQDLSVVQPYVMTETEYGCMRGGDLVRGRMSYGRYQQIIAGTFGSVSRSGSQEYRIRWDQIQWVGAEESGSPGAPNLYLFIGFGGKTYRTKIDDARSYRRGWLVGDYFGALQPMDFPSHSAQPLAER